MIPWWKPLNASTVYRTVSVFIYLCWTHTAMFNQFSFKIRAENETDDLLSVLHSDWLMGVFLFLHQVKSYHYVLLVTLWIRHDLASCKRGPVIPAGFSSGVSRLILQQLDGAFARQQIQISCRTWGSKRQTQHISARICRFLILSCFSSHPFLLIRLSCRHSYYLSAPLLCQRDRSSPALFTIRSFVWVTRHCCV